MAEEPQRIAYHAQHWTDRAGQAIVALVIHGTGGGLQSSLTTLQTGDGRGVSIHVVIDKAGIIYEMVPDEHGANHAGAATSSFTLNGKTYRGGAVNRATLGCELVNLQDGRDPYTPLQLRSLGWWINQKRAAHGPLPLLRHGDLDPTRRRDPYQLSTNVMEEWAVKAHQFCASPPPVSLPTKRYRVKPRYVTQRQEDNGPPYVRALADGEEVTVDKWYTNGRVHLATGEGFCDLADLEAI